MKALTGGRYHIGTGPAPLSFPAPAAFRFGENDEYVKYGHAPFASGGAGDLYWTPEIITQTWFMAERGKILISAAGYGGPFAGSGFDGFWLDTSEIVRPTRDGIHGREYISTAVDLGPDPNGRAGLRRRRSRQSGAVPGVGAPPTLAADDPVRRPRPAVHRQWLRPGHGGGSASTSLAARGITAAQAWTA